MQKKVLLDSDLGKLMEDHQSAANRLLEAMK